MTNTIYQAELQNINQTVYLTDENFAFYHSNHGVCVCVPMYPQENNQL